jgi:hypothetical protein
MKTNFRANALKNKHQIKTNYEKSNILMKNKAPSDCATLHSISSV